MEELKLVLDAVQGLGDTALYAFAFYLIFKTLTTVFVAASVLLGIFLVGKAIIGIVFSVSGIPHILEDKGYEIRTAEWRSPNTSMIRSVLEKYLPTKKKC